MGFGSQEHECLETSEESLVSDVPSEIEQLGDFPKDQGEELMEFERRGKRS